MTVFRKFWTTVGSSLSGGSKNFLLLLIALYRSLGAVHFGGACRFEPSCSRYALDAVKSHHPLIAIRFIAKRLLKCRPGGPWGFDPVPHGQSCATLSGGCP